jgi:hypothetical protein
MAKEPTEITIAGLMVGWEKLLDLEGISPEARYRLNRLVERAAALSGKMFVKTVKGKQMMAQCAEKTRAVRAELESRGPHVYAALTDLEREYEEFLKLVYEFRVKAG